jgi:hypothetical protein
MSDVRFITLLGSAATVCGRSRHAAAGTRPTPGLGGGCNVRTTGKGRSDSAAQMTRAQPTHNCALNNRSSTGCGGWATGYLLNALSAHSFRVGPCVVLPTLGGTDLTI